MAIRIVSVSAILILKGDKISQNEFSRPLESRILSDNKTDFILQEGNNRSKTNCDEFHQKSMRMKVPHLGVDLEHFHHE